MAASEGQRKTRQVPSLKIFFLKELKFTDLCRSLLKTLFLRRDFIILFFFHVPMEKTSPTLVPHSRVPP